MARNVRKSYHQPTRRERNKICHVGYALNELFDEAEILDLVAVARNRVLGEFHWATEFRRGKFRRTDNYIIGVSAKLTDLAKYVANATRSSFVSESSLPIELQDLPPKMLELIIRRAQFDLIVLALQAMRYQEVWYDDGVGIWQVVQSSMDEYCESRKIVRKAMKIDNRHYHGRNRKQSKARGVPEGVSVSFA